MRAQWRVADADVTTRQALAATTGLSPLCCQVLINRGLTDAAAVRAFLTPSLHDLHDPYGLYGMEQAVQRLVAAIRQGEHIAIYGDYMWTESRPPRCW
jgi:single-stranded-DNA-specific exonuclease